MMRRMSLVSRHSASTGRWLLRLQGIALVALAGLVLYEPAVLMHLAAALLVVAGVLSLVLARDVRRIGRAAMTYRYWSRWWWEDAV